MNPNFKKAFFLLLLQLILVFTVFAQSDAVDKFVQTQLAEQNVPGVAVAVIKNGKIVKIKGYGLASVEFQVPATDQSIFEIGSVSKQITAAAIMLLVEDGKVELDEKISKYLPETPDAWKDVTVRNLLNHTSGIPSYTRLGGFELHKRYKVADFIKELSKHPLDFETGSQYRYNNSGYSLLGYIIESASGKTYWDFLSERIYQPLGMNSTANRDPQFVVRNRVTGYEWENGRLTGRDGVLTDLFSAGAIISSVADMAKWNLALRGDKLLKQTSKDEMWKPGTLNDGEKLRYGLGWNISEFRGQKLFSHGGQTAGFAANNSLYVDSDLQIIVLSNLGTQGLGSSIARGIAKIYIPSISLKALKVKPDENPPVTAKFKTAFENILKENFDTETLTDNLIKTLSTERSKANFKRINSFGKIRKFELVETENTDGKTIYRYRVEMPKRLLLVRFENSEGEKVSQVSVEEEE